MKENTQEILQKVLDQIIDKADLEGDDKLIIGYGIEHDGMIDAFVSMSNDLDFSTACKLSVSITGCVDRHFGGGDGETLM